ncbi:MAG: DUF4747 family protein [Methyloceanibacter sp.]|uniref:DUF4747 family protein n=1 Tax=Methyloceanibacter sp. TaxID=1965321 RepID=UPI001DB12E3B|nr:DUF4747 family protein [Methyloceanibacter sp.]MCB1443109.1 DUF4747 family protein [Methyloceanibacter sp.]
MPTLELYALNIAAMPHPDGVYESLLKQAARKKVRARGADFAKITVPQSKSDGILVGRILVWTEIDRDGAWLDLASEQEVPPDQVDEIQIPDNVKPNYRCFVYGFDVANHRLYYEARNEKREQLGPTVARRIFLNLLDGLSHSHEPIGVEVTLIPDEETLIRILRMRGLKRLHMRINRPNADDFDTVQRRVLNDLINNHAGRRDTEYTRAKGEARLTPTDDVKVIAEVAAENGFVEGEADADGETVKVSTREHPKRVILERERGQSVVERLVSFISEVAQRA